MTCSLEVGFPVLIYQTQPLPNVFLHCKWVMQHNLYYDIDIAPIVYLNFPKALVDKSHQIVPQNFGWDGPGIHKEH